MSIKEYNKVPLRDSLLQLKLEMMAVNNKFYFSLTSSFVLNIVEYQEYPDSLR